MALRSEFAWACDTSFSQKSMVSTRLLVELRKPTTDGDRAGLSIRPVMTSPIRDHIADGPVPAVNEGSREADTTTAYHATANPNAPGNLDFTAVDIAASTKLQIGLENGVNSSLEVANDNNNSHSWANGTNMDEQSVLSATQNLALQEPPTSQPPAAEPNIPQIPSENGDIFDASAQAMMGINMQNHMMFGANPFAPMDGMDGMDNMDPFGNFETPATPHKAPIAAYACLEFDDGFYYMNTTRLILGRDDPLYRATLRQEKLAAREAAETQSMNGEPRTPKPKSKRASKYTHSVISQSGGFYRVIGKDSDTERRNKKKSKKSRGSGSSDQAISRRNSTTDVKAPFNYQSFDEEQPAPVTEAHMPDPDHEVTLGIHPPPEMGSAVFKKISRRHARIAYNYANDCFELEVLGTNGLFVNEQHYTKGESMQLGHGNTIQIDSIQVTFKLPDRLDEDDGYETTENGKQISFEFDTPGRDPKLFADSGESDDELTPISGDDEDEEEEEEGIEVKSEGDDEEDDEEDEAEDGPNNGGRLGLDDDQDGDGGDEDEGDDDMEAKPTIEMPEPQMKRGPGRPPKNGIMSKKKQRELEREMQEQAARRTSDTSPTASKNKVGRPRKYPRTDDEPEKTEKRKYTKRKPKDPNAPGGEGEDGQVEKKEKKERRPRSPSPVFNEAELTPEQLAKPQQNYVQLIYDALAARPEGKMSLPQIYRAIIRKYPYFQLKVGTVGWQSSVRHNLSQNEAFMKVERDGKGWMWAIVPGADVTKEKKKKTPPPPSIPPQQQYHPLYQGPPPHMMHGPMGHPPPGYMHGPLPPGVRPGPPHYPQGQMPPHPYQVPPQFQPPPLPPPPPIPQQQNGYSSPYAQKPPPNPAPPPQPSSLGPNRSISTGPPPPGPPQQQPPTQPRPSVTQGPPSVNDSVGRAVESFRGSLVKSLANKSDRAELVVKSAIDRVLGIRTESLVPGDPHEEKIMAALSTVLAKMTGAKPAHYGPQSGNQQRPPSAPPVQGQGVVAQQTVQPYNNPQAPVVTPGINPTMAKPATSSIPSMSRPSLTGPARPSMGPVARPPMMTPGLSRTNSGSPAPKGYSASPAPQQTPAPTFDSPQTFDGVQTTTSMKVEPDTETITTATTLPSTDDGNAARVSTSLNGVLKQSTTSGNDGINDNGKRPLSDEAEVVVDESDRKLKRQDQGLTC